MKIWWFPLSALLAVLVVGCKHDTGGDATAQQTSSSTNSVTTGTTGDSAPKRDPAPAGIEGEKLVGKWEFSGVTMEFRTDGTLSASLPAIKGTPGLTLVGTYQVGEVSKKMDGGTTLNMTFTDVKAEDPAQQAFMEKQKDKLIKTMGDMSNGAFKMDPDGSLLLISGAETKPDKWTKKA